MTTMSGRINFSNSKSNGFKSNFRKAGDAFTVGSGNTSTPAKTDRMGNRTAQPATSGMTEGQKLAQNVRPEYAERAGKFYDQVNSMNLSEDVKGNVLTYMGGDVFLPDPEKVKAKWQKEYADRPELLGNIMTYMGGGAGNVGHNR